MKHKLFMAFLRARALCGYLWRIGLLNRTTCFRWEMDAALGEYSRGRR